jgi:hypothetical protein
MLAVREFAPNLARALDLASSITENAGSQLVHLLDMRKFRSRGCLAALNWLACRSHLLGTSVQRSGENGNIGGLTIDSTLTRNVTRVPTSRSESSMLAGAMFRELQEKKVPDNHPIIDKMQASIPHTLWELTTKIPILGERLRDMPEAVAGLQTAEDSTRSSDAVEQAMRLSE